MKQILFFVCYSCIIFSCEKENIHPLYHEVSWVTEQLYANYFIKLPDYFTGIGLNDDGFNKNNPSGDILVFYAKCHDLQFYNTCVGYKIYGPMPERVFEDLPPGSSVMIPYTLRDSIIIGDSLKGIFYSINNVPTVRGILYWRESDYFLCLTHVKFDISKIDTVKMIIGSIEKK